MQETGPIAKFPEHKGRYAHLDGLRGWAALAVVFHHGMLALDFALFSGQLRDSRTSWDRWLSGTPFIPLATAGNLAVCIFFALSGFVLAHAYSRSRQSLVALVARRLVRLGIPMCAGCLLSWTLLSLGLMHPHSAALLTHSSWLSAQFHQSPHLLAALAEPVKLLLDLPAAPFGRTYDSSLWTMPLEAGGSIVLMIMFVGLRYAGVRVEQFAVGASCLFLSLLLANSYLGLFIFGAALRLLQSSPTFHFLQRVRRLPAALILAGLFFGTVPYSTEGWPIYKHLIAFSSGLPCLWWRIPGSAQWSNYGAGFWHAIAAASILLAVTLSPGLQSAFSRPFGRFLGRISFPLYIIHVPILMVVECDILLEGHWIDVSPAIAGILGIAALASTAVVAAAILTPIVEAGSVSLSGRIGRLVDTLVDHAARSIGLMATSPGVVSDRRDPPASS